MAVGIRKSGAVVDHTFGSLAGNFLLLFILQSSNQVDALLDGSHWRDLMIDFHGLECVILVRIHASLIHDGLVEVFSLVTKDSIIRSTLHNSEVVRPLTGQLEVLLSGWER